MKYCEFGLSGVPGGAVQVWVFVVGVGALAHLAVVVEGEDQHLLELDAARPAVHGDLDVAAAHGRINQACCAPANGPHASRALVGL